MFEILVDQGEIPDDESWYGREQVTPARLVELLRNCSDVMPGWLCAQLDLPVGASFADGMQAQAFV